MLVHRQGCVSVYDLVKDTFIEKISSKILGEFGKKMKDFSKSKIGQEIAKNTSNIAQKVLPIFKNLGDNLYNLSKNMFKKVRIR